MHIHALSSIANSTIEVQLVSPTVCDSADLQSLSNCSHCLRNPRCVRCNDRCTAALLSSPACHNEEQGFFQRTTCPSHNLNLILSANAEYPSQEVLTACLYSLGALALLLLHRALLRARRHASPFNAPKLTHREQALFDAATKGKSVIFTDVGSLLFDAPFIAILLAVLMFCLVPAGSMYGVEQAELASAEMDIVWATAFIPLLLFMLTTGQRNCVRVLTTDHVILIESGVTRRYRFDQLPICQLEWMDRQRDIAHLWFRLEDQRPSSRQDAVVLREVLHASRVFAAVKPLHQRVAPADPSSTSLQSDMINNSQKHRTYVEFPQLPFFWKTVLFVNCVIKLATLVRDWILAESLNYGLDVDKQLVPVPTTANGELLGLAYAEGLPVGAFLLAVAINVKRPCLIGFKDEQRNQYAQILSGMYLVMYSALAVTFLQTHAILMIERIGGIRTSFDVLTSISQIGRFSNHCFMMFHVVLLCLLQLCLLTLL